jgi:threonine dehydratase
VRLQRQGFDVTDNPISRDAIAATDDLISPHIRRTPIMAIDGRDVGHAGGPLMLKLELLQRSGSFKARGAFANMLTRKVPPAGVAAASGGNHGAAVAFAAGKLGHKARIFVPTTSSPAKIERIRSYGAELVVQGEQYADALALCERYIAETGAMSVHAYDQRETLLGQGTIGLEIEADARGVDTVLVAVGGGGLIGGIAAWFGSRVKVVGVEPQTSCALHAAKAAGRPVDVSVSGVAADSLGARRVGELMFAIAKDHVADVVLVSDADITAAQQRLWEDVRLVAEPGGAAALAALLSGAYRPQAGERVCVLICGANTAR